MTKGSGEQKQRPIAGNPVRPGRHAAEATDPPAVPGPLRLKVGPGGRVVVPAEIRAAMGVKEGDLLLGEFDGKELRLSSYDDLLQEIQAEAARLEPKVPGTSIVDEFLAERRAEWGEED